MTFKKLAETRSYLINPSCRQVESWSIRVGEKKKVHAGWKKSLKPIAGLKMYAQGYQA